MAAVTRARAAPAGRRFDSITYVNDSDGDTVDAVGNSRGSLEASGCSHSSDSEEEVEDAVAEDIRIFEMTFGDVHKRYRLINRIGEGTFSTVYKAEDLEYEKYKNKWDTDSAIEGATKKGNKRARYVAIKKIYVTSSPMRIFNELDLLRDLQGATNVSHLITAFRHDDQVVAILPYFAHKDFRDYFRDMTVEDMRPYFHSLFTAVKAVHDSRIIHRDIKPTNFLYDPAKRRGVLVDFGLAEREGMDWSMCQCQLSANERDRRLQHSAYTAVQRQYAAAGQKMPPPQYPADDQRHGRRANRAGTRGFRAPEVLLKCTAQGCKIDVWSCGVILLTLLSKRFPFFHSADDVDAFIELACIFGRRRMAEVALKHGQVMQTNIPSLLENGYSWKKILAWCLGKGGSSGGGGSGGSGGGESGSNSSSSKNAEFTPDEEEAISFMDACLALDPVKRISAASALKHPFITKREGCELVTPTVTSSSADSGQDTDVE